MCPNCQMLPTDLYLNQGIGDKIQIPERRLRQPKIRGHYQVIRAVALVLQAVGTNLPCFASNAVQQEHPYPALNFPDSPITDLVHKLTNPVNEPESPHPDLSDHLLRSFSDPNSSLAHSLC